MIDKVGLKILLHMLPWKVKHNLGLHLGAPDLGWSLQQLRRHGFAPRNVMDVGTFEGKWTRTCLQVFPQAHISCIEPQDAVQGRLQELAAQYPNVKILQTLLGRDNQASVLFREFGSGSSLMLKNQGGTRRPIATIDRLIESGICRPPELLKLDVQGFELEVLEGYTRNFDACQVIQCEISLLPIVPAAPLLHEVIAYFHRRGFVMFDIEELIRGPYDGIVWQIDALFCRMDSPLRLEKSWEEL